MDKASEKSTAEVLQKIKAIEKDKKFNSIYKHNKEGLVMQLHKEIDVLELEAIKGVML